MGASVNFYLEPKQLDFLSAVDDEVMYSGGFGGGKTLMVCLKAFVRAQHPRAVEVLCRAVERDVEDTILPTLFEGSGGTPAILQPGGYIWNKAKKWIRLLGKGNVPLGLIRYRGLGGARQSSLDKMTFRGQNVTGVGIDQAEELSVKQYNNVLGRTRVGGDGLTRQVYGSANPSAPSHWIAQRFGITASHDPRLTPFVARELVVNRMTSRLRAILTCPAENPHLPTDYIARLATYTGVEAMRYVQGRWVASEGLVYDNFLRERHVRDRQGPWVRTLVAIDDGTSKPAAILLVRVDTAGRRYYEEERHAAGMSDREKVACVMHWNAAKGPLEAVVVDPAAAALKLSLSRAGLPVFDARNDVRPGISVVRTGFEPGVGGEPGIAISPRCARTIAELEGYLWDPNSKEEKPVKENDHGPDAMRYAECHIYEPPPLVFDINSAMEKAARGIVPTWRGTLIHAKPDGRIRDASLAMGRVGEIMLEREPAGPLVLWRSPRRDPRAQMMLFASVGGGEFKNHLVIGDMRTKAIVGEFSSVMPAASFARVAAMLALHFGSAEQQAAIWYYASGPGKAFGQQLERLGFGATGWEPTAKEFTEAMGVLRTAWETKQTIEPSADALVTARQYVHSGAAVMHASLVGDTDHRGLYADGVIARAGLWRQLASASFEDIPELEYQPGSLGYMRKQAAGG